MHHGLGIRYGYIAVIFGCYFKSVIVGSEILEVPFRGTVSGFLESGTIFNTTQTSSLTEMNDGL